MNSFAKLIHIPVCLISMKINVAMVSYKNTKPFLFGFNHFVENSPFRLSLLNPAKCSEAFDSGTADIALVPVAFLEGRTDYKIITDFCIGADGPVNSVALLSQKPIEDLNTIILDNHSMTSNRLIKVLLENHWKKDVEFIKRDVSQGISLKENTGVIMIGDKVFEHESEFKYKYDLAEIWKEMTGKPFVFAVWIAKKSLSTELESKLNEYLDYGHKNIEAIIEKDNDPLVNLREYLTINLKYRYTAEFQSGLETFLHEYNIHESVH